MKKNIDTLRTTNCLTYNSIRWKYVLSFWSWLVIIKLNRNFFLISHQTNYHFNTVDFNWNKISIYSILLWCNFLNSYHVSTNTIRVVPWKVHSHRRYSILFTFLTPFTFYFDIIKVCSGNTWRAWQPVVSSSERIQTVIAALKVLSTGKYPAHKLESFTLVVNCRW